LNVLGFGAKLQPGAPESNIKYVNPFTLAEDSELEARVGRLGTRHSSAFKFCRANPDALVIVVSQDGDVRIFIRNGSELAVVEATAFQPEMRGHLDHT